MVIVLRLVDGEQTPMGSLYEAMDRAKKAVRNKYKVESLKFQPLWDIIDRRWSNQLHQSTSPINFTNPFMQQGISSTLVTASLHHMRIPMERSWRALVNACR